VVEWQNAAVCSRHHLRPDGYGVYRHGNRYDGFFLEYDRGMMNARDYFKQFAADYRYSLSGRFERDYNSYPIILVVTTDNAPEERIAQVAHAVAVGRPRKLPLFLTCRWRIEEPNNLDGLLGPIWREPDSAFDDRQRWVKQ
jgi:protein involved in plasmid replication-relaxation